MINGKVSRVCAHMVVGNACIKTPFPLIPVNRPRRLEDLRHSCLSHCNINQRRVIGGSPPRCAVDQLICWAFSSKALGSLGWDIQKLITLGPKSPLQTSNII